MVNYFFESFWFRIDGPSKTQIFYFSFFHVDDFLTTFTKDLMKKPPAVIKDIRSSYKWLLSHKDLRSRNFRQWNNDPLKIFWILHRNLFSLFISLNGKIFATSCLMIHAKYVAVIYFIQNWSFAKQPFINYRSLKKWFWAVIFAKWRDIEWPGDVVLAFLMPFLKSVDTFFYCFCC